MTQEHFVGLLHLEIGRELLDHVFLADFAGTFFAFFELIFNPCRHVRLLVGCPIWLKLWQIRVAIFLVIGGIGRGIFDFGQGWP